MWAGPRVVSVAQAIGSSAVSMWCRGVVPNGRRHLSAWLAERINQAPVAEKLLTAVQAIKQLQECSAAEQKEAVELFFKLECVPRLHAAFNKCTLTLGDLYGLREDEEMRALAESDIRQVVEERGGIAQELADAFSGAFDDPFQMRNMDASVALVEVRAAAGGKEAALFARELLELYKAHAYLRGWTFEIESCEEDLTAGGYREASASIRGPGVFRIMQFESGVHRVQRVPATETAGRMHSSTVSVAILPLLEATRREPIPSCDLRFESFRTGGPGGQHANKTESGVRLTHIPTGFHVTIQEDRSQARNKARCLIILESKLAESKRLAALERQTLRRRELMGRGERSERVRTYNFPKSRIVDHRINLTVHTLLQVLQGQRIDEIFDGLRDADSLERLVAALDDFAVTIAGNKRLKDASRN